MLVLRKGINSSCFKQATYDDIRVITLYFDSNNKIPNSDFNQESLKELMELVPPKQSWFKVPNAQVKGFLRRGAKKGGY